MSEVYDVLIIGASLEGIKAYTKIKQLGLFKTAVISTNFNNCTQKHTIKKQDRIQNTIVGIFYQYGLIRIISADNITFICKKLIIATGSSPEKIDLNTQNIFYNINQLKVRAKNKPILVIGNSEEAVNNAITLAEKYQYIYLCLTKDLDTTKADHIKNIVVFKNCTPVNCKNTKQNELISVNLSNNAEFKCSYIVACTDRKADTKYFANILHLNEDKKILVKDNLETISVPNIFAIGACSSNNKQIYTKLISTIKRGI